jgi:trehalose/maltose transport system substrate-binding protein
MAKGWVGSISPEGVLAYKEEDARGVWQTGNAVFMRNWPYAYALGNGEDSPIKGKFGVTTLPVGPSGKGSAATLGGWNLAVSKYSKHPQAAIELVKFLASAEQQKKYEALTLSHLPTIVALYDDADIKAQQPIIPQWKEVFLNAVPRPSAPTQKKYNEVSKEFWTAVHNTLSGTGTAEANLKQLDGRLKRLEGGSW